MTLENTSATMRPRSRAIRYSTARSRRGTKNFILSPICICLAMAIAVASSGFSFADPVHDTCSERGQRQGGVQCQNALLFTRVLERRELARDQAGWKKVVARPCQNALMGQLLRDVEIGKAQPGHGHAQSIAVRALECGARQDGTPGMPAQGARKRVQPPGAIGIGE